MWGSMAPQVIETLFEGTLFRSRMEARWAVFMHAAQIPYVYEPEGFYLDDGISYLPDFWIPCIESYLEIKPAYPTDKEKEKGSRLVGFTKHNLYFFFETPENPWTSSSYQTSDSALVCGWSPGDDDYPPTPWWDMGYDWCECPHCHAIGIEYQGRADRIKCPCPKTGDRGVWDSPRLAKAYTRAMRYRFWVRR
jgi:hypothetical protein